MSRYKQLASSGLKGPDWLVPTLRHSIVFLLATHKLYGQGGAPCHCPAVCGLFHTSLSCFKYLGKEFFIEMRFLMGILLFFYFSEYWSLRRVNNYWHTTSMGFGLVKG